MKAEVKKVVERAKKAQSKLQTILKIRTGSKKRANMRKNRAKK